MDMSSLHSKSQQTCFGGTIGLYSHYSDRCKTDMNFAIYLPPQAKTKPVPVLYFLSGLTCTDETFMIKAGAQRIASELGIILVAPDTSPRGDRIPDVEEWDFGVGASFYVDALVEPWRSNFQMYSYITDELPKLIVDSFPVAKSTAGQPIQSICGHSMGGHGALVCGLRNAEAYRSISAFAPIGAPMECAWGQKAFRGYLGDDRNLWLDYDASELLAEYGHDAPILIDQGLQDNFLDTQLRLESFESACNRSAQALILRRHPEYDHGYYFIASFIEDHLRHHYKYLSRSV
jgi:S-formylglutathione hydrolase